jgi:NADH:ubiquinone oxidoreductase subunit 5 (subunit L)/multisubunit Na+/H+ antiporter MnhA subunit
VRSLVHSRTLVTAGIFVLLKYSFFLGRGGLNNFIWFAGFITLFLSGLMSLVEVDRKKVVALRTLSQLGLLMLGLGCGYNYVVFFHLLSHAFFKRCLFIQMGYFIHSLGGAQDGRLYSKGGFVRLRSCFIFIVCLISLCGVGFRRGFLRKDFLLMWGRISGIGVFCFVGFFLCFLFTIIYSFRLFMSIYNMSRFSLFNYNYNFISFFSTFILVSFGIFFR